MEINRYFYYKKKEKKFCGCLILGNGIFVIARFFPSFSYFASFYWSNKTLLLIIFVHHWLPLNMTLTYFPWSAE